MKNLLLGFLLVGSAKYCSKINPYNKLDQDTHPPYVHKMEMTLAADINSDDSTTALWAKEFMEDFETNFRQYKPHIQTIEKLKKYKDSIEVKVIGGNWCSDTRREVPRFCKVLYYTGVPVEKFSYYKVDRKKKAINKDFASEYTFENVPTIVVYRSGREVGKIVEYPQKTLEEDLLRMLRKKK